MRVLHTRCAGLDVHKDTVVAAIRIAERRQPRVEVRTFGTTTRALLALRDWLAAEKVTHVAMEATGVYWKPVWHVLEEEFELVLANPGHIKNVPGRKTDVNDAMWIADLLAHGLIRSSFVPPSNIMEIRDVTRARKKCVQDRAQEVQRIQKILEDANIKLASVISDISGLTGRRILEAIRDGETNPEVLADLADERIKASHETLVDALRGRVTPHHRFMLGFHLERLAAADQSVAKLEQEVERLLQPFRESVDLLLTMPGVNNNVASAVVAEIGVDMTRFPTAAELVSWACLCPRNDETAGKRRSTRIRKGAPWLKPMLVQAAWGAIRVKNGYYRALFVRLKSRRGPKKAIIAVAASMLTAMYHMLRKQEPYRDIGTAHFDLIGADAAKRRLVRRLEKLGYSVELTAAPNG